MKSRVGLLALVFFVCLPLAKAADPLMRLQTSKSETKLDLSKNALTKTNLVTLINLNTQTNRWYLVSVIWERNGKPEFFHLENPLPASRMVYLDKTYPTGLKIADGANVRNCELWSTKESSSLVSARASAKSYSAICDGMIYVRNQSEGAESSKEWAADFLRTHVWGGEQITTLVKEVVYQDSHLLVQSDTVPKLKIEARGPQPELIDQPTPALMDESNAGQAIALKEMGLSVSGVSAAENNVEAGKWYKSSIQNHVFFSAFSAGLAAKAILESNRKLVQALDPVEQKAFSYLVAFDLTAFDLNFMIGTKHPSAEWSERVIPEQKNSKTSGPDGFSDFLPLQMAARVPPWRVKDLVATFTGGFKRSHGAFKWGPLSRVNMGSHYGFIENGVVLSKLQPGLATILILRNGKVEMKTWSEQDTAQLPYILHARQNGVAIIDSSNEGPVPGKYVGNWTAGNWSGSIDSKQRALRAGVCLQTHANKNYLIYAYFSSVTPNAMARVFQAYRCEYAMHLDMNALEHTYLAVYQKKDANFDVQHLITGMNVLDKKTEKQFLPRFVGMSDNRDFFYLTTKAKQK